MNQCAAFGYAASGTEVRMKTTLYLANIRTDQWASVR